MDPAILRISITMNLGGAENTVYPTLLWDERGVLLVDCGFIGALPLLESELGRHGLSVREITGLILTHHDHDHMGAAAALKRANPNLLIYASVHEAPFISATQKPLRLRQAEEMQKTCRLRKKPLEKHSVGCCTRWNLSGWIACSRTEKSWIAVEDAGSLPHQATRPGTFHFVSKRTPL